MEAGYSQFYKRTPEERLAIIADQLGLSKPEQQVLKQHATADDLSLLVENYLTTYQLPEGIAVNFRVNDHDYVVPMVTEEPSVIAAASNGAKQLAKAGGIKATVNSRLLTGQVVLSDVKVFASIDDWVALHQNELLDAARQAHPSIVKRGGGPKSIRTRDLGEGFVSIDLVVDVKAAMGANMMNTMLEAVADVVQNKLHHTTLFSILSNAGDQSLTTATVSVPVAQLADEQQKAQQVATRIAQASRIAQLDPMRAVTHNKGIMNGVDAVVLAMGNDWRAIESASHAYAAVDGQYRGLSQWQLEDDQLTGTLTLPMPIGTVGGATKVLPLVGINQKIASIDSPEELMMVIVSVGLAQNFAALKALVTSGIQQGHMKMQLRSLAMSVGASAVEVPALVNQLIKASDPNEASARRLLEQIRNNKET
ncbi:hydroxymethylglutaryl-CoA reductase, degradative [Lactobacillus sp. LC28-10]|uniref:3-hydroxy-3-methylglutaryl coenzyme A reductase n=1 Tax=Secundilactobacillus angelensis TaxID=2722706 RepID=A0ABX1KY34_9LACO|nr:hydroxymethylglutaryl-CoA reductase, degradative [Secundilactobacillus angelensis]MCH5463045.1 hydroxymethylglutaryl-CoA reductase, degradative [Secundilactobacillus angelensis]NLR18852.1 hydroxymethylglutaryl-CoA reductase, degradative [Secundilactobacillus angelensis]